MSSSRTTHTLEVDGHTRALVLHTPTSAAPAAGHPLMFILHGSTEDRGDPAGLVNYPAERFEGHYDEAVFATGRRDHGLIMIYLSARLAGGWFCWENGNHEVGLCALNATGNDEAFVRAALELDGQEPAQQKMAASAAGPARPRADPCEPRARCLPL